MADWLLTISNKGEPSWQSITDGQLAAVFESPSLKRTDCLYVSVPGSAVCSLNKQLPPLPKKNQQQVVGYAIEDQIASPLDSMTICANQDRKSGQTAILWCDQSQLQSWQAIINEQSRHAATTVLPDYLYLPFAEGGWTLSTKNNDVLIRTGESTGLSVQSDCLLPTLTVLLQESGTGLQSITYDSVDCQAALEELCQKHAVQLVAVSTLKFGSPSAALPTLIQSTKASSADKSTWVRRTNKTLAAIWLVTLLAGGIGYYFAHHPVSTTKYKTSTRRRTATTKKTSNKDKKSDVERRILAHSRHRHGGGGAHH